MNRPLKHLCTHGLPLANRWFCTSTCLFWWSETQRQSEVVCTRVARESAPCRAPVFPERCGLIFQSCCEMSGECAMSVCAGVTGVLWCLSSFFFTEFLEKGYKTISMGLEKRSDRKGLGLVNCFHVKFWPIKGKFQIYTLNCLKENQLITVS